jgi:hypothetical protein
MHRLGKAKETTITKQERERERERDGRFFSFILAGMMRDVALDSGISAHRARTREAYLRPRDAD